MLVNSTNEVAGGANAVAKILFLTAVSTTLGDFKM